MEEKGPTDRKRGWGEMAGRIKGRGKDRKARGDRK